MRQERSAASAQKARSLESMPLPSSGSEKAQPEQWGPDGAVDLLELERSARERLEDGPEPEPLRAILAALRNRPPVAPRAPESTNRRICERVEAALALPEIEEEEDEGSESEAGEGDGGEGGSGGEGSPVEAAGAPPPPVARRLADRGVTLRCAVAELVASAPPAAPDPAPPPLAPSLVTRLPPSLPQVVRPPAGLVETARSMEWSAPRGCGRMRCREGRGGEGLWRSRSFWGTAT